MLLLHALKKLKQYQQLQENYNYSFNMSCGFATHLVMIISDSNNIILAKGGG